MPWLVWGFFVRSVLVLHSTWLVNSATHVWGYRSHETRDDSTNLWWVALLTYGEGWHNNHHAFQTSARHGLRWWEIDMTYMAIRLMSLRRDRVQRQAAEARRGATAERASRWSTAAGRRPRRRRARAGRGAASLSLRPADLGWYRQSHDAGDRCSCSRPAALRSMMARTRP